MPTSRQQREFYKEFAQHGTGNALVVISPKDVVLLIHIAYADVNQRVANWFLPLFSDLAAKEFFQISPSDIAALPDLTVDEAIEFLQLSGATDTNNIIYLYLKNLAELYRRRFKFYNILKRQPFPKPEQIGLRCLLEYGNCDDSLLFSWMCWRKLIFDIDNRSAQETGYLFEPVLASCLGGVSVSHTYSPVKRIDENGNATNKGRQVDCYIEDKKEAYELKLRVTIAASGQGRFSEEMSFPYEARMAGLKPILIVFDSTPSPLLERLKEKYVAEGGSYAIGEQAWELLIGRAGDEMGTFISRFIKPPIIKMEQIYTDIPMHIELSSTDKQLTIVGGNSFTYTIPRETLDDDDSDIQI